MPLDDRLRDGLTRNADAFEPDIETALARVTRPRPARVVVRGVLIAAAIIGLVIALAAVKRPDEQTGPADVPSISAGQLAGQYETTVTATVSGAPYDISGRWEIRFDPAGILDVRPPASYAGVVSAQLFQTTGAELRTDVFGADLCSGLPLGTYRWERQDLTLRFTSIDEACAARAAILTSQPWTVIP